MNLGLWFSIVPWWLTLIVYLVIIVAAYSAPWKTGLAIVAASFLLSPVGHITAGTASLIAERFFPVGLSVMLAAVPAFATGTLLKVWLDGHDRNEAARNAEAEIARKHHKERDEHRRAIHDIAAILNARIQQLQLEEQLSHEEKERRDRRLRQKLDDHMLTLRSALRALKQSPQDSMMLNTMDETLAQMVAEEDELADFLLNDDVQQDLQIVRSELQKSGIDDPFLTGRLDRMVV